MDAAKYTGNVYRLCEVPAERGGLPVLLSGEFEVVEYHGYEPAAGITGEAFTLCPAGTPDDVLEDQLIDVDVCTLLEAIDPDQREAERSAESEELAEAEAEARQRGEA